MSFKILLSPGMHILSPVKKCFHGNSNWLVEMQSEHSYGMIFMADIIKFWHVMSLNTWSGDICQATGKSMSDGQVTFISGWCWNYTDRTVLFDFMQTIWWHLFFSDLSVQLFRLKPSLISSHIPVMPFNEYHIF